MRHICRITAFLLLLAVCSCGTLKKNGKTAMTESGQSVVELLVSEPAVSEITASAQYNVLGQKLNGQLRMRRDHCVQLSVSMLGLMEIARIEFLPDRVMVIDRVNSQYVVCHYADIPYRNQLGLDFETIQSIFWNKVFSAGRETRADIVSALSVSKPEPDGSMVLKDVENGFTFVTDAKGRLASTRKAGQGWQFQMDYSSFQSVADGMEFPQNMKMSVNGQDIQPVSLSISLSGISTANGDWPDQSGVSRRMKAVDLDQILKALDL